MASESTTQLTWPEGYGPANRMPAVLVGIPFFTAVAIFFAVGLVRAVTAGETVSIVFFAGGTVVAASFVATFITVRNVRQKKLPPRLGIRNSDSVPAVNFPMGRPFAVSMIILSVAGAVFLVAYGISLFGRDYRTGATELRGQISGAFCILVAVGAMWLAWILAASLRKSSRLAVGASGIEMDNGSVHQVIKWDDVMDVKASVNTNHPALVVRPAQGDALKTLRSSFVVNRMNQRYLREMIIDVHFFQVDPALLYHLLRYYWRHPESRNELTSEAAITRMRSGELEN